jgi:ribose/xylose/arabinose/galactoside ABC-type transport system permease subunit
VRDLPRDVRLADGLIVRLKVPDLLATLGMLFVLQGVQLLPSQGQSISSGLVLDGKEYDGIFTEAFLYIGRGRLFGEIPFPIIVFAACAIALWVVLEKTRWGRQLYAVGGNLEAARLAGIRVDRVRMIAYIVSGVLASLGGIILAARIGEGDVGAGSPRSPPRSSGTPCSRSTARTSSAPRSAPCSSGSCSTGSRSRTSRTTRRTSSRGSS